MLRSFLCATWIFTLFLSVTLLPQTAAARRCPVKEPETLLSLYQNSDAIYIASFDKLVEGEVIEEGEDYSELRIHKHFTISSALKGEARKFFVLEDTDYRYKTVETPEPEPEPAAPGDGTEGPEEAAEAKPDEDEETAEDEVVGLDEGASLKPGDTLLLFVKNGDEDSPAELADYRDGIKKLPMEKISVYEDRIRELNTIFSEKKISEARLIEWLIKCAENPATRWEGTYELLQGVENAEWLDKLAKKRSETPASREPEARDSVDVQEIVLIDGTEIGNGRSRKQVDRAGLARLLDDNHKQTLANILLNSYTGSAQDQKGEAVHGDRELIQLIKRWGDPRLVGYLIGQLRAGSSEAWSTANTMEIVAEILDDPTASEIASQYMDNAYENDEDLVEPEAAETAEPEDAKPENGPVGVPEDEASPADESPEAGPQADSPDAVTEEPAKRPTYRQFRADLLQTFLAQCDKVIAQRKADAERISAR